ncbi:MAG: putative Ig domain-containing protein, partial [Thermoanaerobaculia bacterium]|nr:putative Ig domain-containing protein [Thermoanaerobaculia bacterium]
MIRGRNLSTGQWSIGWGKVVLTVTLLASHGLTLASPATPGPKPNTAGRPGPIGVNVWTPLGPDGATGVYSLGADPSTPGTLFAGTLNGGIFKTVNGGDFWFHLAPSNLSLYSGLSVSPRNPNLVLAANNRAPGGVKEVIRSADGGLSWQTTTGWSGPPNSGGGTPVVMRFDPQVAERVYTAWTSVAAGRFFRSDDGGVSWALFESGMASGTGTSLSSFVLAPASPARLYVSSPALGVLRSQDGGASWQPVNTGLPTRVSGGVTYYYAASLAVDPAVPTTLFVLAGSPAKLYKSIDGGDSWTKVSDTNLALLSSFQFHPTDGSFWGILGVVPPAPPGVCYQVNSSYSVARSTDGGLTWPIVSAGHRDARLLAFASGGSKVYATLDSGLLSTVDDGSTWTQSDSGLRSLRVEGNQALSFAPSDGNVLWAGFSQGLLRTTDGGATFDKIFPGSLEPMGEAIAIHPTDPSIVLTDSYPGQWDCNDAAIRSGLIRTSDGGATWAAAPNPGSATGTSWLQQVWGLAFDPSNPLIVYASGPDSPAYGEGPGIYKSTDGGATIQAAATGFTPGGPWPSFIKTIATTPTTVFLSSGGTLGGTAGLWRSTDAAGSWSLVTNGLPAGWAPRCLMPHPTILATLYACGSSGATPLYVSTDGGTSWNPLGSGLAATPLSGAIDPVNPQRIYLGTASAVYRSLDAGVTWQPFMQGLDPATVWAIALNPSNPNHVVIGTRNGLYETIVSIPDGDLDGIDGSVENSAPNGGDGNGDGVLDSAQSNVTSFLDANGDYVTLESESGTVFLGVRALPPPMPPPPGFTLAEGTFAYSVTGLTPGQCTNVTLYLPLNPSINNFLKYGVTPDLQVPHWYSFLYDGTTGAEIFHEATRTRIVLHFCDGLRGDGDIIKNGVIADPGGPAAAAPLSLTPLSLPSGLIGTPYSALVTATGGSAPYSYEVTSGALPPGLSLDASTGVIAGSPAAGGTFPFTVTARDVYLASGSASYSIIVPGRPSAVVSGPAIVCALQPFSISASLSGTGPWTVVWNDGTVQTAATS